MGDFLENGGIITCCYWTAREDVLALATKGGAESKSSASGRLEVALPENTPSADDNQEGRHTSNLLAASRRIQYTIEDGHARGLSLVAGTAYSAT